MNDTGSRTIKLTIPAKPEYITLGRLALTGLAGLRPLSAETLGDLKLALTEACSNSVRHAYRDGRDGLVEIRYELQSDRLVVEVADDGEGFDPSESTGTATTTSPRAASGSRSSARSPTSSSSATATPGAARACASSSSSPTDAVAILGGRSGV